MLRQRLQGDTSGTRSGITDAAGEVDFTTTKSRNAVTDWCFEVTGVTASGLTYNSASNNVTLSCEDGDVF